MIKITGDVPKIKRVITGLYSFDHAFANKNGDIGFPVGTVTEVHGATGCGKSTTVYGLSGILARELQTDVALADFEGFDPDFLVAVLEGSGFQGTLKYIQEVDDETTLDNLIVSVRGDYGIGILDSIGAVSPIAEAEGELGEANMGRRAKLMAQFARKTIKLMREERAKSKEKTFFLINHMHPVIGGRGYNTPGGETIKYLSAIRLRVKRKEEFNDGSYVLEGRVYKNRFGYKDRIFHLVVLAGLGIHVGMTALYDCTLIKNTNVQRKTRNMIYIDGEKTQQMGTYAKQAKQHDNAGFEVFINKLKELHEENDDGTGDIEPIGEDNETDESNAMED